jgi:hypothetical protein
MNTTCRLRRLGLAATLLAIAGPAAADPKPAIALTRIRIVHSRVADLFQRGYAQSATFRGIVDAIESSDGLVFVETRRCPKGFASCLHLGARRESLRFLWIDINPLQPGDAIVRQLAHELQHAVEILRDPRVVDRDSLVSLYRRIGFRSCAADANECWETAYALAIGDAAAREVRRF